MKCLLVIFAAGIVFADEIPQWVRAEAARTVPVYSAKVSSVVLLQEEQLTVAPDGRRTMRERGVIRILQRSRDAITAWRSYNTKSGRIREFRGWLLPPDGREQVFKPDQVLDVALSLKYTYDEGRAKALECPPTAAPGSVFAYEIFEEEKTIFTQYMYQFQGRMPVLTSRFILSLPAGWEQRDVVFNHPTFTPTMKGATYTWELRDLPWIEHEEHSPGLDLLAPRLGVTCFPPQESTSGMRALTDWSSVGEWLSGLMEPAAEPDEAVRERAAALTAGATSALDRIRAIAAHVQKVNYVSVQMNLTRGGGYTPHNAGQVLSRNYGDCKDKAALMKALLRAAGIESHIAVVYSGNRRHVRPEWPSSLQFNHAIIAIRVPGDIASGAAADYPRLGRLLWFDPTAAYTPLGDLPREEQGSQMLVLAGGKGELVTAPLLAPETLRVDSEIEARLDTAGALKATLQRRYLGDSGASMRASLAQDGIEELQRSFEGSFAQRLGRVKLGKIEPQDQVSEAIFKVRLDYVVEQFGQIQANLRLIKPALLVPGTRYSFAAKDRTLPVRLVASLRQDRIVIQLPKGIKVDEIPDAADLRTPYGTYRAGYRNDGEQLTFQQSLEVPDLIVPASEYPVIREFFDKIAGYQQAVVVLVK